MRVQNAQFIWAYIYTIFFKNAALHLARSYILLFIAAYPAML